MTLFLVVQPSLETSAELDKWEEYFSRFSFSVQLLEPLARDSTATPSPTASGGDIATHRYILAQTFEENRHVAMADVVTQGVGEDIANLSNPSDSASAAVVSSPQPPAQTSTARGKDLCLSMRAERGVRTAANAFVYRARVEFGAGSHRVEF